MNNNYESSDSAKSNDIGDAVRSSALTRIEQVFVDHILSSELVWAAITEAVHRYYHDNILDDRRDKESVAFASKVLSNLWCLYPSWRLILKKKADRYQCDNKKIADLMIADKPKEIIKPIINIAFARMKTEKPTEVG